ncbi:MAG: transglycosylase domain-containing protein, partial [Hyphomicrobiales bacterium]
MAKKKTSSKGGKAAPKGKTGTKKRAAKRPKRSFLRRTAYWLVVLCLWVGILGAGAGAYIIMSVSDTDLYRLPEKERGIVVLAENGEVLASRGAFQGDRVLLDELPVYLPQAVMAIEDRRFYDHFGIDVYGLARAMVINVKAGRIVQGGSTISQQLAKNLFLKPDRTLQRKMQ